MRPFGLSINVRCPQPRWNACPVVPLTPAAGVIALLIFIPMQSHVLMAIGTVCVRGCYHVAGSIKSKTSGAIIFLFSGMALLRPGAQGHYMFAPPYPRLSASSAVHVVAVQSVGICGRPLGDLWISMAVVAAHYGTSAHRPAPQRRGIVPPTRARRGPMGRRGRLTVLVTGLKFLLPCAFVGTLHLVPGRRCAPAAAPPEGYMFPVVSAFIRVIRGSRRRESV